jgi:hypothetical protein
MRFAIVLVAALAACGCSQNAAKPASGPPQAAPPADAQAADRSSEPAPSSDDPPAPNWQVKSIKLSDNRWRVELRMRRWHTGGDGEAEVLFRAQARELAEQQGYRHYVVLSWVQGIESSVPIAQRWARGEIELQEALPPMPVDRP